jgi:hypothetical protein
MKDFMAWWEIVLKKLDVGDEPLTPGRGLQGSRRKPFKIVFKNPTIIRITSGKSTIPLERLCFDTVEKAFADNPFLWLRVAALHDNEPFENSVDKVVRETTGSQLARGNYISSILEHCGLVRYSMRGNKKGVEFKN